jgi:hypothetical protein
MILAGQPVNQNAQISVHRCSVFLIPWISDQLSQSNDYGYNYYLTWIGYSDLPNKDGAYHWSYLHHWTLYNKNCYQFNVASYLSWSACESECSDLGASMLCIPDSATNTWISEQLNYNYYYTWIGYSDLPNKDGAYH